MKKLKKLLSVVLILALVISVTGCYVIKGQQMRTVKGTYKLTSYTFTPSYERREGYTPNTRDYVNGEEYKYEDYLVVTGTGTGYYVHKDAKGDAYIKEVTLRYEYDAESSDKVNYVIYNDSISINDDSGGHRLGVTKNAFNYSKAAFDYTELITKRKMRSDSMTVRWEKVSKATDLSYVTELLGDLKSYSYQDFAHRGIYEQTAFLLTEDVTAPEYQYFFYVIDTATGSESATVYYALKGSTEQVKKTVSISRATDGSGSMTLDGSLWLLKPMYKDGYTREEGGVEYSLSHVGNSVTDAAIEEMIASRLPAQE